MPTNDSDNPMRQIREIFSEARLLAPGPEREAYLDRACAGDPSLRQEVLALLKAEQEAGNFLNHDVVGRAVGAPEELLGSIIDHYRLIKHLGEGGFGDVYLVEQLEPIHRELAMKIIKPGMASRDIEARFLSEREALALMDHPNIARILDAGKTHDGRLYFVMDLVLGTAINRYCDDHHLSLRDRLALFQKVCSAVEHAHQKGILHRDLKPSNIVVVEMQGKAVPKIIDFGIAKALKGDLKDRTFVTQAGFFVGTPAYMSPEQVSMSSESLDTRSDIYSLGVLLYELIAGVQPFESDTLQRAALAEIQRIICEEDPDKPSNRLRKIGDKARTIAKLRASDTGTLIRTIKGDLDWIVMKAIEKDRTLRYQSVDEMARDIERHLHHDPVEAGAPGRIYWLKKFIRRHAFATTVVAILIPSILTGLVLSLIGFAKAREERDHASISELMAQVQAVKGMTFQKHLGGFLELTGQPNLFEDEDPVFFRMGTTKGKSIHDLREMLDSLEKRVEKELSDNPELELEIRGMLADSYLSIDLRLDTWRQLERMLFLTEDLHGKDSLQYADNLVYYAFALDGQSSGLPLFSGTGYPAQQPTPTKLRLQAQDLAREALKIYRNNNQTNHRVLKILSYLGNSVSQSERRPLLDEMIELCRKLYGDDAPETYHNLRILALHLSNKEKQMSLLNESIKGLEAMDDGPYDSWYWGDDHLAWRLFSEGDFQGAEKMYRDILTRLENKVNGERSGYYEWVLRCLINCLQEQGKPITVLEAKLETVQYRRAFNPTMSRVDYTLNITQPGKYRLYVRWDGHNFLSDTLNVRIRRMMDGPGGDVADLYRFIRKEYPPDADFASVPEWQHMALFEGDRAEGAERFNPVDQGYSQDGEAVAAEWEFQVPGDYSLQFIEVESGVAIDAFVLQLSHLEPPHLNSLSASTLNRNGSFETVNDQFFVEAENFSKRHNGRATEWTIVPNEQKPILDFLNYSGSGYIQVLPEREWLDPDALVSSRAFTRDYQARWEESLAYYDEAIRIDPSPQNYYARARAHERNGNFELAVNDYSEAIRVYEKLPTFQFNRARTKIRRAECWLQLGRYDEVIEDLAEIVSRGNAASFMRIALSFAYAYKGMWEQAYACIQPEGKGSFLWYIRGDLHGMAGDYKTAKEWYLRSVEMDPGEDRQHFRLAILYLMDGDKESYRKSQAAYPDIKIPDADDPDIGGYWEFLYISIFGPESCPRPELLEPIARLYEENFDDLEQLRLMYLSWSNIPLAGFEEKYLHKVKGEVLGAVYYRLNKFENAVELLSRAIEIDAPTFQGYQSRWMFFLAMALHESGNFSSARSWYKNASAKLDEERISVPAKENKAWPHPWYEKISVELLQQEAARVLGLDPSPD